MTTITSDVAVAEADARRAARARIGSSVAPPYTDGRGAERRDADLHGREEPLGLVAQLLDRERALVRAADELAQPRLADAQDRDLGAGEQAVADHEGQHDQDLHAHACRRGAYAICCGRCRRGIDAGRPKPPQELHHAGGREEASRRARAAVDRRAPARHAGGRRCRRARRSLARTPSTSTASAGCARSIAACAFCRSGSTRSRSSPSRRAIRSACSSARGSRSRTRTASEVTYRIVGPDESDIDKGWISMEAPVAQGAARQARRRRGHGAPAQGRHHVHDRRHPLHASMTHDRPCTRSRAARRRSRADRRRAVARDRGQAAAIARGRTRASSMQWRTGCEVTVLRDGGQTYPRDARRDRAPRSDRSASRRTSSRPTRPAIDSSSRWSSARSAGVAGAHHLRRGRLVRHLRGLGRRSARRRLRGDRVQPDRAVARAVPARRTATTARSSSSMTTVAFTGGLNISNDYASVEDGGVGWHDMHCRVHRPDRARSRAPVPPQLDPRRRQRLPPMPPRAERAGDGGSFVRLLENTAPPPARDVPPRVPPRDPRGARRSMRIENAYFLPDRGLRRALIRAAARGVDVQVIVPGRSDVQAHRVGEPLRAAPARKPRHQGLALARRDDAREDRDDRCGVVDDRQLQLRLAEPVQQPRGHRRDPRSRRRREAGARASTATCRTASRFDEATLEAAAVVAEGARVARLPVPPILVALCDVSTARARACSPTQTSSRSRSKCARRPPRRRAIVCSQS